MKALHFSILLLVCFFSISCGGSGSSNDNDIDSSLVLKNSVSDHIQKAQIINPVICRDEPTQSYALYIPEGSSNSALPVIYFFDPHGDGLLPVEKYKRLADSFHFILAGSNNSKNGNDFNEAENIYEAINDDVQKRIAVDGDRIYLCGFSGGAKVATFLALRHPEIKGVIANGAGLEDLTTAGNFKFSYTAITGNGDLNMTDMVSIDKILNKSSTRHRIIYFDGIHEWAPQTTMRIAFEGFQLDAMRNNFIPKDSLFINDFVARMKETIEEKVNNHEFIKAQQNCTLSTAILYGVTDQASWFGNEAISIEHKPAFQKEENERQILLQKEENLKSVFQAKFMNSDGNYWNKTIDDVKERAKKNTPEGQMYQRLQAYLSLAFYSISNKVINQNQNKEAQYFVSLYKLADPSNSEAWYFSAIMDARNHDVSKANEDLEKAVALGFNDKKRLENQPEFSKNNLELDLVALEGKMK